ADHRTRFVRQGSRIGAEEIFGDRRSPLRQPGCGERRPSGFQRAIEHVAVAEVLDHEAVGITPIVEYLTALDVPTDSPRALVTKVFQVLAAGRESIEVAYLIRRVHIPVHRAQGECDGVMIGRSLPSVATDEAHRRSAIALAGKKQKVADDHAELLEIPVQRLAILCALQHHMPEALYAGRPARGPLCCIGTQHISPEIEGVRRLSRQRVQLTSAGYHANRHATGVVQVDREPADRLGQGARLSTVGLGKAPDIGLVARQESRPDEPRYGATANEHTRRAWIAATQVQLIAAA